MRTSRTRSASSCWSVASSWFADCSLLSSVLDTGAVGRLGGGELGLGVRHRGLGLGDLGVELCDLLRRGLLVRLGHLCLVSGEVHLVRRQRGLQRRRVLRREQRSLLDGLARLDVHGGHRSLRAEVQLRGRVRRDNARCLHEIGEHQGADSEPQHDGGDHEGHDHDDRPTGPSPPPERRGLPPESVSMSWPLPTTSVPAPFPTTSVRVVEPTMS